VYCCSSSSSYLWTKDGLRPPTRSSSRRSRTRRITSRITSVRMAVSALGLRHAVIWVADNTDVVHLQTPCVVRTSCIVVQKVIHATYLLVFQRLRRFFHGVENNRGCHIMNILCHSFIYIFWN